MGGRGARPFLMGEYDGRHEQVGRCPDKGY